MDPSNRRPRVLVVEDNADTRLLLKHLLSPQYDVRIESTVDDVLAAAAAAPFSLLVADINLGEDRTGIDVLKHIRAIPGRPRVPALALTAYAMPGDEELYLAAGFDAYLSKPFTSRQLLRHAAALVSATAPPSRGAGISSSRLTSGSSAG